MYNISNKYHKSNNNFLCDILILSSANQPIIASKQINFQRFERFFSLFKMHKNQNDKINVYNIHPAIEIESDRARDRGIKQACKRA